MRNPFDLWGRADDHYRERKTAIAQTRALITDALLMGLAAQDGGDLDNAQAWNVQAFMLCDDLNALIDDWRNDFPESYGERGDRSVSTSLGS